MLSGYQLEVVAVRDADGGYTHLRCHESWDEAEEAYEEEAERLLVEWKADPNRRPWRPEPERSVYEIFEELAGDGVELMSRYAIHEAESQEAYEIGREAESALEGTMTPDWAVDRLLDALSDEYEFLCEECKGAIA